MQRAHSRSDPIETKRNKACRSRRSYRRTPCAGPAIKTADANNDVVCPDQIAVAADTANKIDFFSRECRRCAGVGRTRAIL